MQLDRQAARSLIYKVLMANVMSCPITVMQIEVEEEVEVEVEEEVEVEVEEGAGDNEEDDDDVWGDA
jgi:hypothetical protein